MRARWMRILSRRLATAFLWSAGILALATGCQGPHPIGLQFSQIVQGNHGKAQAAAQAADEQTCAAAAPYREAARAAADQSAALASEADQQAESLQAAMAQHAEILAFTGPAAERLETLRTDFEAARAEFDVYFEPDLWVRDSARLGSVRAAAGRFSETVLALARGMETLAMDFEVLVATDPAALAPFLDSGRDPAALSADFRNAAGAMLTDAIAVYTAEYTVPNNMDVQVGSFKWPAVRRDEHDVTDEYESFQEAMGNLHSLGMSMHQKDHRSQTFKYWTEVSTLLDTAQQNILASVQASNDRLAQIADQTQLLSAEAGRNAWLAISACGGTVPPAFLGYLENPFDSASDPVPSWNSTFWDFNSP